MSVDEAIAILEHFGAMKMSLANAPRTSPAGKAAGDAHRRIGTAIAVVLANLPDGARGAPK